MLKAEIRKRKPLAVGISSGKVGGSSHIPLMDFDRHLTFYRMFELAKYSQVNKLGSIRIILTPNGYHLYFLSVLVPFKKYLKMLRDLGADKKFISHVALTGYGTLRISPYAGIRTKPFKDGGYIKGWEKKTPQGEIIDKILDRVV